MPGLGGTGSRWGCRSRRSRKASPVRMRNGHLIRLLGHVQAALSVARGICGNSQKRNRRRLGSRARFPAWRHFVAAGFLAAGFLAAGFLAAGFFAGTSSALIMSSAAISGFSPSATATSSLRGPAG